MRVEDGVGDPVVGDGEDADVDRPAGRAEQPGEAAQAVLPRAEVDLGDRGALRLAGVLVAVEQLDHVLEPGEGVLARRGGQRLAGDLEGPAAEQGALVVAGLRLLEQRAQGPLLAPAHLAVLERAAEHLVETGDVEAHR